MTFKCLPALFLTTEMPDLSVEHSVVHRYETKNETRVSGEINQIMPQLRSISVTFVISFVDLLVF